VALSAGAGTGATALGEVLTAGRALVGGAIDAAGRVVGNAGLGLAESLLGTSAGSVATGGLLLIVPSQIGQRSETYLGADTRFVQQSDMRYGQLEERNAQGDWEVLRTDVRKYEVMGRVVVLSDDELTRLNRPTTTPITPPQPSGPPPLPAWVDNNRPNPGYTAAPAGPTTIVTPAAPQPTAAELIIEQGSSERDGPRNGFLAGSVHPDTGIPFDSDGYPDFSAVAVTEVSIDQTGSRAGDFRAANEAAGYTSTPEGFSWHHHQDGTTMQLVPRDLHARTGHTGGFKPRS
jgi:hypothetical protein